jgi:HD-GYP domain-containing protein (c-di-GMP phosphodiesterase class II)
MEFQLGDVIRMFRRMGDLHSPSTEDHAVRVRDFALRIGERLKLSSEQMNLLKYAADAHDIGKMFIDASILYKPGRLNKAQRGQVEKHCELGVEAVEPIHLPADIMQAILHHHEHYDGSGYPNKLKGEEIPLFARVVTIADMWDALNSDRPHRTGFSSVKALEIMNQSAAWFDPKLFAIFLDIVRGTES